MDYDDAPSSDDDPVENFIMSWGLPGFVVGVLVVNAALFYICHRAVEFFFPGA
jgi:hypothetical protein